MLHSAADLQRGGCWPVGVFKVHATHLDLKVSRRWSHACQLPGESRSALPARQCTGVGRRGSGDAAQRSPASLHAPPSVPCPPPRSEGPRTSCASTPQTAPDWRATSEWLRLRGSFAPAWRAFGRALVCVKSAWLAAAHAALPGGLHPCSTPCLPLAPKRRDAPPVVVGGNDCSGGGAAAVSVSKVRVTSSELVGPHACLHGLQLLRLRPLQICRALGQSRRAVQYEWTAPPHALVAQLSPLYLALWPCAGGYPGCRLCGCRLRAGRAGNLLAHEGEVGVAGVGWGGSL